jgi:uncharacterized SAM-binding protein YcdF (DUF218 family)
MASLALIVLAVALGRALLRLPAASTGWRKILGWLAAAALLVLAAALSPGGYELRKFVGACLMPAGLVWLGLLAFARVLAQRVGRPFAGAALALWLLYTVAGNAWFGSAVLAWLQRGYVALDPFGQGQFDAVLVLGGGVDVRDDGKPMLTAAGDRVVLAVRLFRAGKTPLLVTSGPYLPLPGGKATSTAAATAAIWRQLGVPEESIVLLEGPRTTTDEVLALKRAAADRSWKRVGLLTSAWHLRRAMGLCRHFGVEVTPLPSDAVRLPQVRLRWLVPQEIGFFQVQAACWELLGALAGR